MTTRLAGELGAAEVELDVARELYRGSPASTEGPEEPRSWERAVETALESAKAELANGRSEIGWIHYFSARRMELAAFRDLPQASLVTRATVLYREAADALDDRHLETIAALLCEDGEVKPDVSLAEMYEASRLLQEHYVESYLRITTFREQLWQFVAIGALTIGTLFLYAAVAGPLFGGTDAVLASSFLVPVVLFGVLGASVSGLLSIGETSIEVRHQAQPLSRWLSLARAVLGGAAAIALFAFLQSGLLQLGTLTPGSVLAIAFVAGFTERLLLRAVGTVVGDQPRTARDG